MFTSCATFWLKRRLGGNEAERVGRNQKVAEACEAVIYIYIVIYSRHTERECLTALDS